MAKSRKRPGPKSRTAAKSKAANESGEELTVADKDADKTPDQPSVSSPVLDETETEVEKDKESKDDEEEASEEPVNDGPKILNELDGTLVDAPEEEQPEPEVKPILRLVPLTQLLKPEVINKPAATEKAPAKARKASGRAKKSTSYIEISSDESSDADQISISSSSDEVIAKKMKKNRNGGSSKENNSTNNKLSNGSSTSKNSKDLSVHLEKIPNNVNKLMKCYKVDQDQIESWSDTDDFENMISTSKIDRNAPEKVKNPEKIVKESEEPVEPIKKAKKTSKAKKDSDEDVSETSEQNSAVQRSKRPERNSARNAKQKTKTVMESDKSSSSSSSDEEDEDVPLKSRSAAKPDATTTTRGGRNTRKAALVESDKTKENDNKKKRDTKSNDSDVSSSDDKKQNSKRKKKIEDVDDHGKEKIGKTRREKSTSSEEEEKEVPTKGGRSKKTKETQPARTTRTRRGVAPSPERTSPRKGKAKELKIVISLAKKKVTSSKKSDESSDEKSEALESEDEPVTTKKSSKAEKEKSSGESSDENQKFESEADSDDDKLLKPVKLGPKKLSKEKSPSSESESSSLSAAEEIEEAPLKEASASDSEEKPTILDQKLRTRNKFEKNSAFLTLKQKIEQRKVKRKVSSEAEAPKVTSRIQQNGKESKVETNNNGDDNESRKSDDEGDTESIAKAKKLIAKRKRLISSSEEENSESKPTSEKKKKMSSPDDSDYDQASGEEKNEKENDSEDDKSDGDDKSEDDEKSESNKSDESSDDEQPRKRKKAASSNSDDNEVDDIEKNRPKDKRRKRIKKVASSDEEGVGENGEMNKSGRKNIRKMMRADKLDVSTKEAAKIERERKQRIEERQKTYNQFYDERPEEAKEISQLVLDFSEKTKKPLLQVDKKLAKKLKPHQANGVKFMWDACFESLERCKNDLGSGCILAHCMGLGKTLQVITLVHTLIKNQEKTGVSRALVVCPLSTVLNWVNEFNIWLKDIDGMEDIYVYEINKLKQNADRANKLMEWHNDGGIMILSYEMFRNLTNDTGNRLRKKIKESLQTSLVDPGPDLVICDEGHLLKNEKTSISKAMMRLRTLRRIVLTGTPLQNNLKEYYCMVQFVKPNLLGKYQEYLNRFVNPITNGQYTDSTEYDIQVMRRRAHVLHKMLDGCVQRRDYAVLAPFLPPKHEYVLSIKLTPMQVQLYKHYMESRSRSNEENGGRKGSLLFQDFQNLQRIWTAPLVLRYNSNRYEIEMQRRRDLESDDESEGSLKDFIDDSDSAASTSSSSSGGESDEDGVSINSDEPKKSKKKKSKKFVPVQRRTRAKAAEVPSDHEAEEIAAAVATKVENPTEWWMQICPEEELNNLKHSSKLMLLMSILQECEAIGDKLLVFSQSLYSLDVIEHFLNHIDEQTQQNTEATFTGSWTQGQDYFRLDGSTPVEQRNSFCKHFNSASNPRARLFLISTRAGGLGINLVAANRVIIFDVSWNPSHDIQSIFRVYRFGQNKPCYVYRFLALGTMEEKIYERQVTKQAISKRVIDEQQIDRHYNQHDLQELYNFDLEPDDERILPILPKDRLFAELLKKYEDTIYKYHEHDTLLENKEEETLGEEERKQAWEEFEQEKNRPQFVSQYVPQQPRGNGPVTSNNIFGIRTDVLLKLLSMKARMDNPIMTDSQVKQAIPLLMQELYRQMDRGELTLYQQLIALSSSLEVPQNYGGQFRINENLLQQSYSSIGAMPSTSSFQNATSLMAQQQQLAQQEMLRYAQQQQRQKMLVEQMRRTKVPPRIVGSVIEID